MMPKIVIDQTKCTTPFACRKCFDVCGPAVFFLNATRSARGKEQNPNEPGSYQAIPCYVDLCTGCMDCVRACPVSAISVTLPEEVQR